MLSLLFVYPGVFFLRQVSGRGQLHLTVLIENMRREGFELLVGPPTVITKQIDGKIFEPFEIVEVQVRSYWTTYAVF